MGHFLATTNPEAAARIGHEQMKPETLPNVGQVVTYFARPGDGRAGRPSAPMAVTHVNEDLTIDGVVLYDAQDFRDVKMARRISLADPIGWDWANERPSGEIPGLRTAPQHSTAELTQSVLHLTAVVERQKGQIDQLLAAVETFSNAAAPEVLDLMRDRLNRLEGEQVRPQTHD